MPIPLGFGPPPLPPPLPVKGPVRYYHVIQAGFGTSPPADPLPTVTHPGVLNLGGWTTISGVTGNPIKAFTCTRTAVNKSTGEAEPGIATFTVLGDNGWLDPTNPGSPYTGYLVPGVAIRALITDGKGNYWPEWRGFVKRWPMSQGSKPNQDAPIECYGPLGWLGAAPALYPTDLHRAILATGPSSYWPHDDASATTVRDLVSGFDANLYGGAALSGPSLTPEGYGASLEVPSSANGLGAQPSAQSFPPAPFTVSLLIRIASTPSATDTYEWFFEAGQAGVHSSKVYITNKEVGIWDGVAPYPVTCNWDGTTGGTGGALPTGGPFLLTMTYDTDGTLSAWWNGNLVKRTFAAFQDAVAGNDTVRWGAPFLAGAGIPGVPPPAGLDVQISHVAVWQRVLAASEISGLSDAALNARAGEYAGPRINYLLDRVGWPASMRSIGAGAMPLGPVRTAGVATLDLVKRAVQYDDGILAETADGKITFWGRRTRPAPTFAFGGAALPKETPVYSTSETTVVTSAAVSEPPVIYTAGVSLTNGRHVDMKQLANSTDDAWLIAQRTVQLGTAPRPGIDAVTLDPVDVPDALTLDLAYVGTVTRRPIWSPTDLVEPQQVISVTGTGGGGRLLKRTFGLLQRRPTQWYGRVPPTYVAGTASGFVAPWQARFDSADVSVAALFRCDTWGLPNAYRTLVSHGGPGAYIGWSFVLNSFVQPQRLTFTWADNGGVSHTVGSQALLRTGTRYIWALARFSPGTGTVQFFVSTTNVYSFASWGQVSVGPTTLRATGNGPIEVGCINATSSQLAGDVLQAIVTTYAGAPIATFDPTADNQPGASSWVSSSGETWSPEGVAGLIAS